MWQRIDVPQILSMTREGSHFGLLNGLYVGFWSLGWVLKGVACVLFRDFRRYCRQLTNVHIATPIQQSSRLAPLKDYELLRLDTAT